MPIFSFFFFPHLFSLYWTLSFSLFALVWKRKVPKEKKTENKTKAAEDAPTSAPRSLCPSSFFSLSLSPSPLKALANRHPRFTYDFVFVFLLFVSLSLSLPRLPLSLDHGKSQRVPRPSRSLSLSPPRSRDGRRTEKRAKETKSDL